jgi:soluble lytic murein transglycosylase-like protein
MKRAVLVLIVAALAGQPLLVRAQESPAYPDFTFKMVKVPPAGTAGRITVQIDPAEQARYLASRPRPSADAAASGPGAAAAPGPDLQTPGDGALADAYAWYWDQVSPQLAYTSPARLENAVNQLANAPGGQAVNAPRLQDMQDLADRYGTDILIATIGTRVSPALALAVIGVESSGQAQALSPAGAQGLMQLMPDTAQRFGVKDANDPAENIRGGVAYLDWLMKQFSSDPVLVLAAYNAGENALRRAGGVPAFAETRAYVPRVLAAWTVARTLCLTPPDLVSDGCVFAGREARANE